MRAAPAALVTAAAWTERMVSSNHCAVSTLSMPARTKTRLTAASDASRDTSPTTSAEVASARDSRSRAERAELTHASPSRA